MAVPNYASAVLNALGTGGMDGAGAVIDDCTKVVALSAEAASYSEADTNLGTGAGKKIVEVTVTAGDFSVSGTGLSRKVTFAGKAGGTVTVAGPANPTVIAFLRTSDNTILAQLNETGSVSFSSGGAGTFSSVDVISFGPVV